VVPANVARDAMAVSTRRVMKAAFSMGHFR
jgi:hypothetical protein